MKKNIQKGLAVVCALALLLCVCVSCISPKDTEESLHSSVECGNATRITRFLVLGRDRAAGLTDSILVVSLDECARKASILQIPRDTYANYTERDYRKLNGALDQLGVARLKETLSKSLGVPLDYFVILELSSLKGLVDAIGGVDVQIEREMQYSDPAQDLTIRLEQGMQHLNGEMAEQFVRYRAGYPNADLGRLDAQKQFLRAFAAKCKEISPKSFCSVLSVALTSLQTDISVTGAIRVSRILRECDATDIPMMTLAGEAIQGKSGAWYYVVNRAGGCRMVNALLSPPKPLTQAEFDPNAFFDRPDYGPFHQIYTAPDGLAFG